MLLAAVGAAAFAPASVEAQSLDTARERWFEADFDRARRDFDALLESPSLERETALEAHRHLAVLYLVLGDEARARAHAEAAVAIEPRVTPPEGAPGSAEALFEAARERLGDAPATLRIEPAAPLSPGEPGTVRAELVPAPTALASTLRLRCEGEEIRGTPPSVEVRVTAEGTVRCTAEALSTRGAVLVAAERELAAEDAPRERRPLPWIIAGSVAAAAIVAVVVGVTVSGESEASFGGTTVVGW